MHSVLLWGTYALLTVLWLILVSRILPLQGVWQITLLVAATLLFLMSVIWLRNYARLAQKLRSLKDFIDCIQNRAANDLSPISIDGVPSEIQPLVSVLNNVLKFESERMEYEHQFSSEVSHELRTPLTGIRLQAQIAQRASDAAMRDKALKNILSSVNRCSHLMEQLLILSRVTRGQEFQKREKLDLETVCRRLTSGYYEPAKALGVTLEFRASRTFPCILSNDFLIENLLRNLLENALHNTPVGGQVLVKLEGTDDQVTLTVEDSGPGIPPEQYVPFRKSPGGQNHGTGLGLAIVKRIVDLHHGQLVLAASSSGGLSASVTFTIPEHLHPQRI